MVPIRDFVFQNIVEEPNVTTEVTKQSDSKDNSKSLPNAREGRLVSSGKTILFRRGPETTRGPEKREERK